MFGDRDMSAQVIAKVGDVTLDFKSQRLVHFNGRAVLPVHSIGVNVVHYSSDSSLIVTVQPPCFGGQTILTQQCFLVPEESLDRISEDAKPADKHFTGK